MSEPASGLERRAAPDRHRIRFGAIPNLPWGQPRSRGQLSGMQLHISKDTEALQSMISTTAKLATWCVRVIVPKVINYSFTARGKPPQRSHRLLVPKAPEQYMHAAAQRVAGDRIARRLRPAPTHARELHG